MLISHRLSVHIEQDAMLLLVTINTFITITSYTTKFMLLLFPTYLRKVYLGSLPGKIRHLHC